MSDLKEKYNKDDRVEVPIDIPDDVLLVLAKNAHALDITLNEYINRCIKSYIKEKEYEKNTQLDLPNLFPESDSI